MLEDNTEIRSLFFFFLSSDSFYRHIIDTMATALTTDESTTPSSSSRSNEPVKKTECLIPASRFVYNGSEFEYTVFSPSARFMREMDTVFPQLSARQRKELLVIPIIQRCKHDLVGFSPEIEEEREFKLENVSVQYTNSDDS